MNKNNLSEFTACPLCGKKSNIFYNTEIIKIIKDEVKLGLNKCDECGMQFISPRLNKEGLKLLYSSYKTSTVSGKYNTESDVSKLEYIAFAKYIRQTLPNGGRILDVGCGIGNLISEFKGEKKYDIFGIEFSEVPAKQAIERGFNVKCGDLISERYPSKSFDAIVLLYVLEHVPNPREILREINRLLKDDGRFFMAVPNYRYLKIAFDNKISRMIVRDKISLHAGEHLQNYTPVTLRKMLELENYRVVSQKLATPLNTGSFLVKITKWSLYILVKLIFLFGYNIGGIHIIAKKANHE